MQWLCAHRVLHRCCKSHAVLATERRRVRVTNCVCPSCPVPDETSYTRAALTQCARARACVCVCVVCLCVCLPGLPLIVSTGFVGDQSCALFVTPVRLTSIVCLPVWVPKPLVGFRPNGWGLLGTSRISPGMDTKGSAPGAPVGRRGRSAPGGRGRCPVDSSASLVVASAPPPTPPRSLLPFPPPAPAVPPSPSPSPFTPPPSGH